MSDAIATTQGPGSWPSRLKSYVDELRDEMRLVTWPPWKQVRATTIVVIAAVFAFSLYFMVVDTAVGWVIDWVFRRFTAV